MVLMSMRALLACSVGLVLSTGCKASLFDDGKNSDDPNVVGSTCPADCLGDAARDFNGTATGAGDTWRYLDDHRDRTWTAMTASADKMTGADPAVVIGKCTSGSKVAACAELPGALLISTAGASSAADPAIEFTVAAKRVVKVGVRAFVPTTAPEQQIRIYRNSREDVLFAGPATPGTLFEKAVSVDALAGDRLLVAIIPASGGATDVGLELFVSDVGTASSCQVALTFNEAVGTTVPGACGAAFDSYMYSDTGDDPKVAPTLGDGPFPELGKAALFVERAYYKGSEVLNKTGDVTIQYWLRVDAISPNGGGWPFSDEDLFAGGGIGNAVYTFTETRFDTQTGTPDVTYVGANTPHVYAGMWEFVRLVHSAGKVSTCINGKQLTSFDLPTGKLNSGFPPYLGKNVQWTPSGAFFIGAIDDVRVLSAALPCE
jgi:Concanavalin A-like lectin/glucanases superfamily